MKTRDSLKNHNRARDLKEDCEIVVDLLALDGTEVQELDVLGWLHYDPLATWVVIADPLDVEPGEYLARIRILQFSSWLMPDGRAYATTAPFTRDGLADCYAYEGRLERFETHTIENYTG